MQQVLNILTENTLLDEFKLIKVNTLDGEIFTAIVIADGEQAVYKVNTTTKATELLGWI